MSARVEQNVVEVLDDGAPSARVQQSVVEVLDDGGPSARAQQSIVEVLVNYSQFASPGTATIGFVSEAPTVSSSLSVVPGTASIELAGFAPTVSLQSVLVVQAGAAASLVLSGFAPTLISYAVGAAAKRHLACGHWHAGQADVPSWSFAEQNNLDFAYHEHDERARVCGHWHKQLTPVIPCIEYVSELTVSFSEASGLWSSTDALVLHDDGFIYGGDSASGTIFQYSRAGGALGAVTALGDLSGIFQIEVDANGDLLVLCTRSGWAGKWIQKVARPTVLSGNEFTLSGDALYCGAVVLGTDGKKYGCLDCLNLNSFWRPQWQPTTGALFSTGTEQLSDGYSGKVWNDFADYVSDTGAEVSFGSHVVNFKLSAGGFVLNCGPGSSFLAYSNLVFEITSGGDYVQHWTPNTTIGPAELVRFDSANFALTTAYPNWKLSLRTYNTSGASGNFYDFPLVDSGGSPYDSTLYQGTNRACLTNGLLYNLNAAWPNFTGRIVALDPVSGTLAHQFVFGDGLDLDYSSFIIVGDFVYVWQNVLGTSSSDCAIAKFNLALELICIEPCLGQFGRFGNSREIGGQLVSDSEFIYNFNKSGDSGPAITKYRIAASATASYPHDPRWTFEKQSNKFGYPNE